MSAKDGWATVAFATPTVAAKPLSNDVVIGKDLLELLTGAMYSDPMMIFREYVQNAADAIDELVSGPRDPDATLPSIRIEVDTANRRIVIRDTGTGVPKDHFERQLSAIGASTKRGQAKRGFRGVGRLSGLGYSRSLIFRSRRSKADPVMEMSWDGKALKQRLRDPEYRDDLGALIRAIASVRAIPGGDYPARFFEVELGGVARIKNDALLNPEVIVRYLGEVAPVEFGTDFKAGIEIAAFLADHGVITPPTLTVVAGANEWKVTRPHADSFDMTNGRSRIRQVETFILPGIEDEVAAVGWVAHHDYLGALSRSTGMDGIRVRCGGVQIGDSRLLDELFPEARFNAWSVGEVHVLSQSIVPNGRRDNFEPNAAWLDLQGKLAPIAMQLSKRCREESIDRNRVKSLRRDFAACKDLIDLANFQRRFSIDATATESQLEQAAAEIKKLADSRAGTPELRKEAAGYAEEIQKLTRKRKQASKDPLSFLSAQKRNAYREVFSALMATTTKPRDLMATVERAVAFARKTKRE